MYKHAMIQVKVAGREHAPVLFMGTGDKTVVFNGFHNKTVDYVDKSPRQVLRIAKDMWGAIGASVIHEEVTPSINHPESWEEPTTFPGISVTLTKMLWYVDPEPGSIDSSYSEWHLSLNKVLGDILGARMHDGRFSERFEYLLLEYLHQEHGFSYPRSGLREYSPTGEMFSSMYMEADIDSKDILIKTNSQRDV